MTDSHQMYRMQNTRKKDLKDYMRQAGDVTYADAHKVKNQGVVEFASHDDMRTAIEKLDDTELNGRRITIVEDKSGAPKKRRSHSRSRSPTRSRSRRRSRSRSYSGGRRKSKSRSRSRSKSRSRSHSRSKSKSNNDRSLSNSPARSGNDSEDQHDG